MKKIASKSFSPKKFDRETKPYRQNIILQITPKKQKIYKWFWYFIPPFLDGNTITKINAWEKIPESDYQFLREVFVKKNMKVSLDDVSYIFNYLKFLKTVSTNGFNLTIEDLKEASIQLLPLLQAIKEDKDFFKISIQVKGVPEVIEISSDNLLKSFKGVFKGGFQGYKFWKRTKQYLEGLEEKNLIQSTSKRRTGNKTDYVKTVVRQSVGSFKGYLNEFGIVEGTRKSSVYTIIGEVLEKVGLIDPYANQTHYRNQTDYYRRKAYDLDVANAGKKTQSLVREMYPPWILIQINEKLIV